jgi:hypothetical protein
MHPQSHAMSIDWRRPIWIALMVIASIAFSLGFACATPFAAFAAAAALTMNRRDAMLLVGLVWLANQGVGFGVLIYPWTAECLAWGIVLGIVALLRHWAPNLARNALSPLTGSLLRPWHSFSAFGVYEGFLFIASMIFQSGVADYAPAIVERIFAINAVASVGLLVVNIGVSAGLVLEPRRQLVATGRRS